MWDMLLNRVTEYCRNNLPLVAVAGACVLLILLTVIILIAKGAANKKAKKRALKAAEEAKIAEKTDDTPQKEKTNSKPSLLDEIKSLYKERKRTIP